MVQDPAAAASYVVRAAATAATSVDRIPSLAATAPSWSPFIAACGGEAVEAEPKVHILLVDDHPEDLLALEALLSDLGQHLV